MSPLKFLASWLLPAVAIATMAIAHEGHEHRAMGVVTAAKEKELELKTTAGKTVSLVLDAETKFMRGAGAAKWADIKTGERVAVTYVEKEGRMVARVVRMASPRKPLPSPSPTQPLASPTAQPSPRPTSPASPSPSPTPKA